VMAPGWSTIIEGGLMEIKACRHILDGEAEEFAEITTDAGEEYSLCGDCYIKGIANYGKDPSEVIGYHVYRSDDPNLPKAEWTRITPEPIPTTRFKDRPPQVGVKYHYYVTAVNARGIESPPSAIASVTPLTSHSEQ
jgi:hypothetical protein